MTKGEIGDVVLVDNQLYVLCLGRASKFWSRALSNDGLADMKIDKLVKAENFDIIISYKDLLKITGAKQ